MEREQLVLEMAREAGFDLAGLAPLGPPPAAQRFEAWLEAGRHGEMAYLVRQRERILDPRRVLGGEGTLLVLGLGHSRDAFALPDGARVARYAAGRDYHNLMGKRLRKLARRLEREGLAGRTRSVVDAGPLLERSHAAHAGLGFESKAANLLHPDFGPWFFLGEILLDVELTPTGPAAEAGPSPASSPSLGSCGTCRACLQVCPTGALLEPGVLDARLCLSYQTIENRGTIPHELRPKLGDWAFGCDLCSEVCPLGQDAPDLAERFGVHPALREPAQSERALAQRTPSEPAPSEPAQSGRALAQRTRSETGGGAGLVSWLETTAEAFPERFRGSALQRPRRDGLARNAALVLGNRPGERGLRALLRALDSDPSALVREAAGWGLAHGHRADAQARRALDRALAADPAPEVRLGLRRSLEGA